MFVKDNWIYTEKIFYTNKKCVTQLLDKSDNYSGKLDELFRIDINKQLNRIVRLSVIRDIHLLDDIQIKQLLHYGLKLQQLYF
jgi:hypothetical protein